MARALAAAVTDKQQNYGSATDWRPVAAALVEAAMTSAFPAAPTTPAAATAAPGTGPETEQQEQQGQRKRRSSPSAAPADCASNQLAAAADAAGSLDQGQQQHHSKRQKLPAAVKASSAAAAAPAAEAAAAAPPAAEANPSSSKMRSRPVGLPQPQTAADGSNKRQRAVGAAATEQQPVAGDVVGSHSELLQSQHHQQLWQNAFSKRLRLSTTHHAAEGGTAAAAAFAEAANVSTGDRQAAAAGGAGVTPEAAAAGAPAPAPAPPPAVHSLNDAWGQDAAEFEPAHFDALPAFSPCDDGLDTAAGEADAVNWPYVAARWLLITNVTGSFGLINNQMQSPVAAHACTFFSMTFLACSALWLSAKRLHVLMLLLQYQLMLSIILLLVLLP